MERSINLISWKIDSSFNSSVKHEPIHLDLLTVLNANHFRIANYIIGYFSSKFTCRSEKMIEFLKIDCDMRKTWCEEVRI